MHAPGLSIAMPSTPYDAKGLLKTALRQDNPVVFIEHVRLYRTKGDVPSEDYTVPFGRARIVREGSDITLVALAAMVSEAIKVAEELEQEGISVEVIDPRTLAPLDRDTLIASVKKTGRAIITHEAYKTAGAGAEIGQTIMEGAFDHLLAPIQRVAGKDIPIPAGVLENRAFPSREELKDTARLLMGGS